MIKQLFNSKIAKYRDLSWSRKSVICLSLRLRDIIDLLAADKSRYFSRLLPIIVKYSPRSLAKSLPLTSLSTSTNATANHNSANNQSRYRPDNVIPLKRTTGCWRCSCRDIRAQKCCYQHVFNGKKYDEKRVRSFWVIILPNWTKLLSNFLLWLRVFMLWNS